MNTRSHPTVVILASLALLLAACSEESSQQQAENGQTQQAPARATSVSDRVMGHVRWDDLDLEIRQVQCRLFDGAWSAEGRGDGFRFSAELSGQQDRTEADLDFGQHRSVHFRIEQDHDDNMYFFIHSNHNLAGEIEGSTAGFSGQTRLIPGNAAAGRKSHYPVGIDVEFEINCP